MIILPANRSRLPRAVGAAKRKRAPKPSETDEHRVIAAYFRKVGLGGCAVAMHIRNERAGHLARIRAAEMGVLAGCPDWLIVDGQRAGFIELKPRGWRAKAGITRKLTDHEQRQLETHARLKRAGAWVEICETLDEVLAVLRRYGVPLRSEPPVIEAIRQSLALYTPAQRETVG